MSEDEQPEAEPLVKFGIDEVLEAKANRWLSRGVKRNARSVERDVEMLAYQSGALTEDELEHYDPTNDWDSLTAPRIALTAPGDIAYVRPSECDGSDGNVRAEHPELAERKALMRHIRDDQGVASPAEYIPLLGANEITSGKVCTKCKLRKRLEYFSPKSDSKDGLHPWCKKCRKEFVSQKREKRRLKG